MTISLVLPRRAAAVLAFVLLALVAGGLAYAYFPSALITVSPVTERRSVTKSVTLSRASEPDYIHFQLPVQIVEVSLSEEKTYEREGGNFREDFARGRVTLVNTLDEPQQLLPRTHLRHADTGTFFLTDTPVEVPAGGTIAVTVTAKAQGADGNVPAGRFIIDKLPSSLQSAVYAESAQSFSGGVAVDLPLAEEELVQAREDTRRGLEKRVRGELTVRAEGAPIRDDLTVLHKDSEQISAAVGSAVPAFSVLMSMTGRAFVTDDNDLRSLALLALRAAATDKEELIRYVPESFAVTIEHVDFSRQQALVNVTLDGLFAPKLEPSVFVIDNLAGRTEADVQEYFSQFPSVDKVTVDFSPFWVTRVPARLQAVEIRVAPVK